MPNAKAQISKGKERRGECQMSKFKWLMSNDKGERLEVKAKVEDRLTSGPEILPNPSPLTQLKETGIPSLLP
jgi:hypothetical protein